MQLREDVFLKENGLDVAAIDKEALLATFIAEMEAGLAGQKSSLMMIPSFISLDRPVQTDTPVVVLDAGGTNLRAAVVVLDSEGQATLNAFRKSSMPGTRGHVSKEEFFQEFADFVSPVVGAAAKIGFCFSYAAEAMPNGDARLIKWSKQIDAPAIEGELVGAGLLNVLAQQGYQRRIVILNDTVATLLAGRSAGVKRNYSAYVGFILGTGTNTAYVEKNVNITKRSDLDPAGSMAINVESGAFQTVEQSRFDRALDRQTRDCGRYTFEKMISGAYLGSLGFQVLLAAAQAGTFFSTAANRTISAWTDLANKHLDDFCGDQPHADNPLLHSSFSAADQATVKRLCTPLFERAAILTAVNLASAVIKTGAGQDAARPVCVNIDGSTYYRTLTADFQNRVQKELAKLLAPRRLAYELIKVDESPVIGAAVAGLMS